MIGTIPTPQQVQELAAAARHLLDTTIEADQVFLGEEVPDDPDAAGDRLAEALAPFEACR